MQYFWQPWLTSPLKTATLIFGLVFVVYASSFFNTFIWDDEQFIFRNQFTTSLEYLPEIFTTNTIAGAGEVSNYYRPLTTVSFTIDRLIWGLRPFGFHLTNTAIHASAAVLLWWLLRRLGMATGPAMLISLVFGIHPLQTEAVTYISSRGDSLYVWWLLISYLCFSYVMSKETLVVKLADKTYKLTWPWLAGLTIIAFGCAVLSKEIALAGLGLYPVFIFWQWRVARRTWWVWGTVLAAVGSLVGVYLGLRLTVLNFANSLNFHGNETLYTQHLWIRLFTFCRVLFRYVQLLLFPYPLHMERSEEVITTWWSPWWVAAVVVAVGVVGLGWWEYRRRQTAWIWLGGWWFISFLIPVSGIVPINGLLYEHWLYMPIVGFCLVIWGLWQIVSPALRQRWGNLVFGITCLVLLAYAILTIRQNWLWRGPIPFYTYTLQHAESARLWNNLGMAYAEVGESQAAIDAYRRALAIQPNYYQIHYNLARSYVEQGELASAEVALRTSLAINPDFVFGQMLLIDVYRSQSKFDHALPLLESLEKSAPTDIKLLLAKGEALFRVGREDEAEIVWQRAYQLSQFNPQILELIRQLKRPAQPENTQQ